MMVATDATPAAETGVDPRRPATLDFAAAILLLATIVLRVVAMVPVYFTVSGSLMSQPDQAALYSVLAASWALALVIGLTGPHRTPVAAALSVGLVVTELGLRLADLGDVIKYGSGTAGNGLWLMEAAWVVGAAAAVTAVLAARARHRGRVEADNAPEGDWRIDWTGPAHGATSTNPYAPGLEHHGPGPDGHEQSVGAEPEDPTVPTAVAPSAEAPTVAMDAPGGGSVPTGSLPTARGGDTSVLPIVPEEDEDPHERLAWTLLVVVLAAVVAGAFLPAWDHAVAVSTQTGQSVSRNLGNAFKDQPWQQVVGTVLTAAALLVVPVVGVRMRNKAVGAALAMGSLLVLASQFVSAVVQIDQPVPPSDFGITNGQARDLALQFSLRLTGWFTLCALAAYALFATMMVWATLRVDQANSEGTSPSAPDRRNAPMPSPS